MPHGQLFALQSRVAFGAVAPVAVKGFRVGGDVDGDLGDDEGRLFIFGGGEHGADDEGGEGAVL